MELGTYINAASEQFEEIEDEELWQDGELSSEDVKNNLYWQIVQQGEWKIIRRIDGWVMMRYYINVKTN